MRFLIMILPLFLLSGCFCFKEQPSPDIIVRDKLIPVYPADAMLTYVNPPKPPDMNFMLDANDSTRIKTLGYYTVDLLKALTRSNINIKYLKKWKEEQIKIFENNDSKSTTN